MGLLLYSGKAERGGKGNKKLQGEYEWRLQLAGLMRDFPGNLTSENAEEARDLLNKLLSRADNTLNEVLYHFDSAMLDMADKEYQNAASHLQYVVSHSGKLSLAAEADTMLKECGQFH